MSHVTSLTKYVGNFVDQLYQSGVRHIVISPGSRSTPLSLTFTEYNKFQIWVDIDERSAAFYALGIAKETNEAVVLVCSSGTAAANYYPAVIEAYYSRIPLIVLTADRPHELRDVGAPQAIDQVKLFGQYVKDFHEMALPGETPNLLQYARNHADRAVQKALFKVKGPVHLNFPFREPLIPDFSIADKWGSVHQPSQHYITNKTTLDDRTLTDIEKRLETYQHGLIVCGPHDYEALNQAIIAFAEKWQLPILADPLSSLRSLGNSDLIIDSYDGILKAKEVREKIPVDFIIRFGAMPVSKAILQLLQEQRVEQIIIDEDVTYRDPSVSKADYLYGNPVDVAKDLAGIPCSFDSKWRLLWTELNERAKKVLSETNGTSSLTEGEAVLGIREVIPNNSNLFVGNSMPIRDVDTFWFTNDKQVTILANRGANGIDGVISTALGTSVSGKHVTLLIGDLSLLHSMNGLLLTKQYKKNLTIVVINNNGGGIFSFLPQASHPTEHYETLYGTPQDISMEKVAALYDIDYQSVNEWNELRQTLTQSYQNGGVTLIEIQTDRTENVEWHRSKWESIKKHALAILEEQGYVSED